MALVSSCVGAVFGTIVFTYLFAGILKWWDKVKEGMFSSKHPKKDIYQIQPKSYSY